MRTVAYAVLIAIELESVSFLTAGYFAGMCLYLNQAGEQAI